MSSLKLWTKSGRTTAEQMFDNGNNLRVHKIPQPEQRSRSEGVCYPNSTCTQSTLRALGLPVCGHRNCGTFDKVHGNPEIRVWLSGLFMDVFYSLNLKCHVLPNRKAFLSWEQLPLVPTTCNHEVIMCSDFCKHSTLKMRHSRGEPLTNHEGISLVF